MSALYPFDQVDDICWQPAKLKSKQLGCRQLQRTPGPGVGDVVEGEAAPPRDPAAADDEATGQGRRALRLAAEWRPPPLLQLPKEIRPWTAGAYRGSELSVRASARNRTVSPEVADGMFEKAGAAVVGLLRDLESRSSGLSEQHAK
eukprot:Skav219993  [mRNA]  locus=scaffold137:241298:245208:- [translate_table: standard]